MANHKNRKKLPFVIRDMRDGNEGVIVACFATYDVAGGFAALWSRSYRCDVQVWADYGRDNPGNGIVAQLGMGGVLDEEFTPFDCVMSGTLPGGVSDRRG